MTDRQCSVIYYHAATGISREIEQLSVTTGRYCLCHTISHGLSNTAVVIEINIVRNLKCFRKINRIKLKPTETWYETNCGHH
jgi:hypothetical protein